MKTLSTRIKEAGRDLGFSMVGITPAQPSPRIDAYLRWIREGMHGSMGWMARDDRRIRREDLTVIMPEARSLVIAALDYHTLKLPAYIADDPARGRISNYAWNLDYHDLMLPRLEELAGLIEDEAQGPVAHRTYVDTGAILERSHAAEAGVGFVGKNTMLIHPRRGSYFFLGEIITNLKLAYDDAPEMPGCGSCTRCLDACPTSAFPEPYVLDARLCISYLTIEHRGPIPRDLRPRMGNWVYGCDVCQAVCPWQRFAQPTPWNEVFAPVDLERAAPPLERLLELDETGFRKWFTGSPIERIGRDQLVRNACVAAGNSQSGALAAFLERLLYDKSDSVRGHAAWGLGALNAGRDALQAALDHEDHLDVRDEIRAALELMIS